MQVRILHQGLTADGKVFNEGDITETSNPNLIAFALGLKQLRKFRKNISGHPVLGDFRAAEAVNEPTEHERTVASSIPSGSSPVPIWTNPPSPTREFGIADASIAKLAEAVSDRVAGAVAEALDESSEADASRRRGRPRKDLVEA